MSRDGKLVTYVRRNDGVESDWDLHGLWLGDGTDAREFRITRLRTPVARTPKVKTALPSWEQRARKYLRAFSIDGSVHLVFHDGTSPRVAPLTDLAQFPARRDADTSFHRIRLNPVFRTCSTIAATA